MNPTIAQLNRWVVWLKTERPAKWNGKSIDDMTKEEAINALRRAAYELDTLRLLLGRKHLSRPMLMTYSVSELTI